MMFVNSENKLYKDERFKGNPTKGSVNEKEFGKKLRFATVGAGEKKNGAIGTLTSGVNREKDVSKVKKYVDCINPFAKNKDINEFFELEEYYRENYNNVKYALFPTKKSKSYNSNSFAKGIIAAAGYNLRNHT